MTEEIAALIVEEAGIAASDLASRFSLIDLGVTSFVIMRLLVSLEERFQIEFSEDQMEQLTSAPAAELVTIVERAISGD